MRGAFSVAAVNAGRAGDVITVEARSTGSSSPMLVVNETDPTTGAVIGGNRKQMSPGTTATFAVFAAVSESTAFDPANNRVSVEFRDGAGAVRGSTSVALSTVQADRVVHGADLFFKERFDGNGRTCGTCHPADNNFTLDPAFIARLAADDPLFVAETNPALAELENSRLLREFALILENADGFDQPAVPRGVPHTLALATSIRSNGGPRLGWSGDGAPGDGTLRSFATGAVTQHFTKTLSRVPGIDFRLPSDDELVAMEAFQLSLGRQADLSLPLPLRGAKASSGQAIFLDNSVGRCNVCHVNAGATANLGAGSLGNEDFDTGMEGFPPDPPRPTDVPRPPDGGAGRAVRAQGGFGNGRFNLPPLVEAASTPPFFHGNAVQTIEAAVAFYTSPEFSSSPGARDAGGSIDLSPAQIEEVAAFLRVINALESLRSAAAMLVDAALLTGDLRGRLLELVGKAIGDAERVLADGGLHPDAVAILNEAHAAAAQGLVDVAEARLRAARALLIET
jgi:cytochrome c peroxidase